MYFNRFLYLCYLILELKMHIQTNTTCNPQAIRVQFVFRLQPVWPGTLQQLSCELNQGINQLRIWLSELLLSSFYYSSVNKDEVSLIKKIILQYRNISICVINIVILLVMSPWLCNSNASFSIQSCFVNKLRNLQKNIIFIKGCFLFVHNSALKLSFFACNLFVVGLMMYAVVIPSQEKF